MAHEYNHILQFGIDSIQDGWLFESTAVWAEEKVFPNDNDYLFYLKKFAKTPSVPITDFNGAGGLKIYGAACSALARHRRRQLRSRRRARQLGVLRQDEAEGLRRCLDRRVGAQVRAATASSRSSASSRRRRAEWRTGGGFPDAAAYPDMKRKGSLKGGKATKFELDHTAYQLMNVPATTKPTLTLKVKAKKGVTSGIALVGRDDQTATVTREVRLLEKGGKGSVTLAGANGFERITAVVVNADGTVSGFSQAERDWVYTQDNIPYTATLKG